MSYDIEKDVNDEVLSEKLDLTREDFMNALYKDNLKRMDSILKILSSSSVKAMNSFNLPFMKRKKIASKYDALLKQLNEKVRVYKSLGMPNTRNLELRLGKINKLRSQENLGEI